MSSTAPATCPFAPRPALPAKRPAPPPPLYNPLTAEFVNNPYPFLHRLRATEPVHYSATLGVWVFTRYADIHASFRDERFSSMASRWEHYQRFVLRGDSTASPIAEMYSHWMLQKDPPDHSRLRGLVNKAFTPRVVEAMRPRITAMVEEMIDRVIDAGRMDVMADLAFPLPTRVICELLGIPREDVERVRGWSMAVLPSLTPALSADGLVKVNEAIVEFREFLRALADERRREPKADMLTALIAADEKQERLSEMELLATVVLLAFAGHASTTQLIGKGMHVLLSHPDQLEKLRRDPSLIVGAVEEILRYETPFQIVYRTTKQTVTIGEKTIPPNQMIFMSLAGANRDPAQFPDPDRFDITRDASKHLSFAYGSHYCVGAPLARLEAQVAINVMLRRLGGPALASDTVKRERSLLLRGLTELPVTFERGASRGRVDGV